VESRCRRLAVDGKTLRGVPHLDEGVSPERGAYLVDVASDAASSSVPTAAGPCTV